MYPDGAAAPVSADSATDILALLGDRSTLARVPQFRIDQAQDAASITAYRALRLEAFVREQGLFDGHDLDERDEDPRTIVLVARERGGRIVGGVRLGPVSDGPDIGWWQGGRLVVASDARGPRGLGSALVRAACARAESEGALRFEAHVQARNEVLFARLGWQRVRPVTVAGTAHVLMRWQIGRISALTAATKARLGTVLGALPQGIGGAGYVGDDGAPLPGTDVIAACDAIVPAMVERDPEWAGWCSVLVNINDLAAMGARPVGLLDALGAKDAEHASHVLKGLARAAEAYGVPVLGGHTQFGVPAALSVTALGRTEHPIPGGGGRPGHAVQLTADLHGGWRPGYRGRQWDSTSHRTAEDLRMMIGSVAAARPAAAKDVSMAGIVGTLGMLAEAGGCAAILDMESVRAPAGASMGDWLTCFPGFAMLTADDPGAAPLPAGPAVSVPCGTLTEGKGVGLRWPDGEITAALDGPVTGMGPA